MERSNCISYDCTVHVAARAGTSDICKRSDLAHIGQQRRLDDRSLIPSPIDPAAWRCWRRCAGPRLWSASLPPCVGRVHFRNRRTASACPLLCFTMKQAAFASSMSHGGGKRQAASSYRQVFAVTICPERHGTPSAHAYGEIAFRAFKPFPPHAADVFKGPCQHMICQPPTSRKNRLSTGRVLRNRHWPTCFAHSPERGSFLIRDPSLSPVARLPHVARQLKGRAPR